MTWREEAKELGIEVYDRELKRPRKKVDVLADIEHRKKRDEIILSAKDGDQLVNIIVNLEDANKICGDALFSHVRDMGFTDIVCEGYVSNAIYRKKFLNCKRKGIIFRGTKDVRRKESESEGTSEDVPDSVQQSSGVDSPGEPEEVGTVQQVSCAVG